MNVKDQDQRVCCKMKQRDFLLADVRIPGTSVPDTADAIRHKRTGVRGVGGQRK